MPKTPEHSITLTNPTNSELRTLAWLEFPYKEKEGDTPEITVFLNTKPRPQPKESPNGHKPEAGTIVPNKTKWSREPSSQE